MRRVKGGAGVGEIEFPADTPGTVCAWFPMFARDRSGLGADAVPKKRGGPVHSQCAFIASDPQNDREPQGGGGRCVRVGITGSTTWPTRPTTTI